ncbi:MAG TPA: ABC transporter permease [Candidatus Acidoferrum sp.]|nr:ABC transporter permease [Candidatus Acidoferrum sp.]
MTRAYSSEAGVVRLYQHFLRLYPAEFRDEYRRELSLAFLDRWREQKSSAVGLLFVLSHAIFGIFYQAPKEHYHVILQDLRYALRIFRKDPLVTLAAILILALGIGSTTLVFSLANGLLLRPLPYPQPERIIAVTESSPNDPVETKQIAFPNYFDMRARDRLLDDIGVYASDESALRGDGPAEHVPSARLTDGVFRVLGVEPVLGRVISREDDLPNGPKVVVIGEELWQRRYGRDPQIIGKTLQIDDSRWSVIGVMPAGFHFPDRAELWLPIQMDPAKAPRTDYFLRAVARLKPGISVEQAGSELESLLEQIHRENPATSNNWVARAIPIREFVAGSYSKAAFTLLVAVALLLLIACANVCNLLLVKASARVREIAVRTALGATRRRLLRQLVTESLLLGLAGGALGVVLAYAGIPALLSLIPVDLPRWMNFAPDFRVLGFAVAVSLLTTLTFGIIPAFGSFHADLADSLKEGGRGGTSGMRSKLMRHGLVVGEVALSVILLAGAGLMIRSFLALRGQNLGYRPENVLTVNIDYPDSRYKDGAPARALLRRLTEEVSSLPGVTSTAFSSGAPLNDGWGRIFTVEGHPLDLKDMSFINHVVVTPGYFHTLAISLLQGRDFTEDDFDSPRVVVVSESFAKKNWPSEIPVGKRIRFGPPKNNEPWHTVVGVVADSKHGEYKGADRASVYLPYSSELTPNVLLIRTTGDPLQIQQSLRTRVAGFDPDIVVSHVLSLEQIIERVSWQDRFLTILFTAFAALALLLAAVGLYATISYTVSLNTHEIGIRMALGASASRVRTMILRQGMSLAAVGLVLGIGVAFALARALKSQLYAISPSDPATYAAVPLLLLLVAALAAFLPAHRATRVDPVIALRHE